MGMRREVIAEYLNGNVFVKRFDDGSVIRYSLDDEFNFEYPENLDVKITDCCDMGCKMCHEGSTPDGKHGNIMAAIGWVNTLKPYTEIALGGGNIFTHPDLLDFLDKLYYQHVFVNITVNQKHFMDNINLIRYLVMHDRIRGIGVSLIDPSEAFFTAIKEFPNLVIHVIAGVLDEHRLQVLMEHGKDLKILILGYKKLRRGNEYYSQYDRDVDWNIGMLERDLSLMFDNFKIVSFDCLAIEQLHVKDHLPKQIWDVFFQGEDGTMTFYIDMVNNVFAKSSTEPLDKRYSIDELDNDVQAMFQYVKNFL